MNFKEAKKIISCMNSDIACSIHTCDLSGFEKLEQAYNFLSRYPFPDEERHEKLENATGLKE